MPAMRVLRPCDGVFAFFDGRVSGYRFDERPNWVDEGALSLGIASYAVVGDAEAVVYDTHVSIEHARNIRRVLEGHGVRKFTVVLSHWHLDHVAGNAVFEDSEIIASERTAALLAQFKSAIERGELHTNIHSDDATLVWLPEQRLLLCGDTMEDPVTYVDEPQNFDAHLNNLAELSQLDPDRVLPNHGDPGVIAGGGYSAELISATEQYIQTLKRCRAEPELRELTLRELIVQLPGRSSIHYFAPYEAVHRHNIDTVLAVASDDAAAREGSA